MLRLLLGMAALVLSACVSEPTTSCHCPEPVFIESVPAVSKKPQLPVAPVQSKNAERTTAFVVGTVEFIRIQPGDLRIEARIDSGAKTSSLHARRIEVFERGQRRWVRFETQTGFGTETARLELPLIRTAKIKAEGESVESRPVVLVEVRLGTRARQVEMSLTDRGDYDFPVLIGRNFLGGDTLIDTGRTHVQGN